MVSCNWFNIIRNWVSSHIHEFSAFALWIHKTLFYGCEDFLYLFVFSFGLLLLGLMVWKMQKNCLNFILDGLYKIFRSFHFVFHFLREKIWGNICFLTRQHVSICFHGKLQIESLLKTTSKVYFFIVCLWWRKVVTAVDLTCSMICYSCRS